MSHNVFHGRRRRVILSELKLDHVSFAVEDKRAGESHDAASVHPLRYERLTVLARDGGHCF